VEYVAAWLLGHLLFSAEFGLLAFLTGLAFVSPELGADRFQKVERSLGRLAAKRGLAVLTVGLVTLVTRAALLPVEPVPEPTVHDEFSYLLAADTFASGRMANPTHPLWMHFETMHEDSHPNYASMYPPAQGLVLAVGKRVFGSPFAGVWLSAGFMCGAICWMLQGWLPPGWALLGGLLVVIRLGSFSYWADSYWGGAVAATGGALLLGALPRIIRPRHPGIGASLLLGVGVAILLNSRPYEGAVLSATAGAILLTRAATVRDSRRPLLWRFLIPALVILLPAAILTCYYNWRVFGSPLTFPYQVNRATYAMAKVFVWQQPSPEPAFHHKAMRDFFVRWEMDHFRWVRTPSGFLGFAGVKLESAWRFFVGPVLSVPLLMLFWVLRDRRIRPLVIVAAVYLAALAVQAWFAPHYAAPVAGLIWLMLLQGMRHLRLWRRREKAVGLALVRMIPAVCVLMFGIRIASGAAADPVWLRWPLTWATAWTVPLHRQDVIAELKSYAGPQLVIVRYSENHDPFQEYVFNDADIDGSRIVWAREMGKAQNRQLVAYFNKRRIWLLKPDVAAWTLSPYPAEP
jgi:hypothetical protein